MIGQSDCVASYLIYADRAGRRTRQIFTDLFVVAWVWFWIWAATRLYDLIERLAAPGRKVEDAGAGMADNLAEAGSKVDSVPAVGDALAAPFDRAAGAARALADAGREQQEVVREIALVLSLLVLAVPLALVLFVWLPLRVGWVRRAGAAATLRSAGEPGRDLLALRALANQPMRRLAAIGPDAVTGWRRGDPATIDGLAALELRSLGLRLGRDAARS